MNHPVYYPVSVGRNASFEAISVEEIFPFLSDRRKVELWSGAVFTEVL